MLINELFNSNSEPVIEGVLDNPGQEDSPVAQAIIRRILMQRTDLLAKHGPEKVGQAVDEVADFVGDVDEIGSSDVSGWVRHVEQMLGNMQEGVAENNDPYKPEPYDEFASDTYGDDNPEDELGVAEGSDGWIGNPAKWKEAVLQAHGPDVVFKNYTHPGQPGKRSVNAINTQGKQVGVYQRHNKMGIVQPNQQGVAEGDIGQLEKDIAAAPVAPIANMEAQEKIAGRHDADDFDDMVSRLKKLAGAGPMRTVYDPNTRRYKNVPVAQQPTDKK